MMLLNNARLMPLYHTILLGNANIMQTTVDDNI